MAFNSHSMTDPPLVSIIIPAYNFANFLAESIESCLNQTYSNIEIIVVDDGSTDNTCEVVRPYSKRITYHYQNNCGLAGARNTGHRLASGKYLAWLDADDIACPDRIFLQVSWLEQNNDTAIACGNFSAFDENGNEYENYSSTYYDQINKNDGIVNILPEHGKIHSSHSLNDIRVFFGDGRYHLIFGNFIHPPTVMFRMEAIKKTGNLRSNIQTQEDWEYLFRASRHGKIAWIDTCLIKYRLHSSQMSSSSHSVNILSVFNDMIKEEPEYVSNNIHKIQKTIGFFSWDAAYTFIEKGNKKAAIPYLKKSFQCNPLWLRNYKLLAKLLVS
jgi:glycosyltransferase involved in cell wall biosynthesis